MLKCIYFKYFVVAWLVLLCWIFLVGNVEEEDSEALETLSTAPIESCTMVGKASAVVMSSLGSPVSSCSGGWFFIVV